MAIKAKYQDEGQKAWLEFVLKVCNDMTIWNILTLDQRAYLNREFNLFVSLGLV